MELTDVEQLIDIIKDARISELTISTGSPQTTIKLRKPAISAPLRQLRKKSLVDAGIGIGSGVATVVGAKPATSDVAVFAPMVGIFHSIDSIAAIGSSIKKGQVVGSIESMKLMNDVISGYSGIIVDVLVEDGMPVEYGQNLFVLSEMS
jgi:biotin carboxyl carrier protein